ncbi:MULTISPECIES: multiple monosaccharide ABC transporter ATP-binding protein [unclassified Actinomyces]|uniref:multiple monosaccharide ABC transporter ATP-binding protein n=1 Tax=unclassified Actinomyces TaxID=2609248 RepID=UPI0020180353|nr:MULTISPECIES: multiple monosaccharide ABC transporter ATP-binding protein [unclassified Actinomyces]MCL3777171.1 ATP-binding cassette domain-containing protein [Actinomyces sp. AC-20-1]MCL3789005.1 ATP-binding cassette domain-containing protein [Actinomyces sp. 187325]MCL3791360.1 ATP-binding cassette domain-containing protein [Actinomyces sp. 186855]MCL3793929.1 ATP-binding cassette domain-containing protein [Actinomyces sp. 217892]
MSTADDVILQMRHITKAFGDFKALDDVTFDVRRGEIHAICGENGAGKSTLMNVLSGVWPRGTYEGEIIYDGEVREFRSIRDSEAVGIVIIHQELALSPYLSVAENIFLGNERQRHGVIDWDATNEAAAVLLQQVGLDIRPQTRVADLGVGSQQLVEIAKALSKDVRLLILDEPTAALNDEDSAHLLDLMRGLREQGISMVMISHKLGEVSHTADRTTIVRDGQTIQTSPLHGEGAIDEDEIIRLMVGRSLDNRYPEHTSTIGEEVLEIRDWTVHHPLDTARKVVDGAALSLRRGEIVGLAGLMGAGRTELAMSVFGHSYGVDISGTVLKDGKEVSTSSVRKAMRQGLAYVSEDRKVLGLNLIQDVKTNTTAAALDKISRHGIVDDAAELEVAERYCAQLRTKTASVSTPVGALSGGNQQKVVLSRWMFTDPDVLILDEPTRGIDVGAKYEIYTIINQLADAGKAVLVISSELPELLGICDRIYTMSQGRITGQLPRSEATQESLMRLMTIENTEQTDKDDAK